jgi:hypothetical protein
MLCYNVRSKEVIYRINHRMFRVPASPGMRYKSVPVIYRINHRMFGVDR